MLTLNDGRSELWQWDTGRTLAVDADCSQVHFSNKVFGRSIDVDVIAGKAIIPDVLLQIDKDLNVWAFVGTAENGYTKISKTFKVNRRNKPADYVFTPPDQTTLAELSERLDKIEESQDPDAIKNAVENYLEQNPVEAPVDSVNGKTGAVQLTAADVGAIAYETDPTVPEWAKQPQKPTYTADEVGAVSQADLQEATNEALAQAKASGEFDGAPGADGKSAYQYAQEGGYTGTEAEFAAKLAEEIPDTLPNPNALTFSGAVTGSYDGSAAVNVEIPSGGIGSAETGYKDAVLLFDVTLDDTTGGLKSYEYDVSGIEKTDVIIINILFPASYTGTITIKNQADAILTTEFPSGSKGMAIGLKIMNGRYMHSCVSSANTAARFDMPLSLFYGQINGLSGFERPKAPDTITKLKFTLSAAFVSGTRIRAYRW